MVAADFVPSVDENAIYEQARQWLEESIRTGHVEHPKTVTVKFTVPNSRSVAFTIYVRSSDADSMSKDVGQIIGRKGCNKTSFAKLLLARIQRKHPRKTIRVSLDVDDAAL